MSEKITKVRRPTGDDENDAPNESFQRDGNVRVAAETEGTRTDGNRLEDRGADGPLPSRPNGPLNRPEDGRVSEIDRIQSLLDEEPLSLAEEIAEECDRTGQRITRDDIQERYEQIKQGDIHIAELQRMSMPQLIEQARKENLSEIHRHQEAGPDLQDPQGAREAQRLDVSARGRWKSCRMGSAFFAVPITTTCRALTTSMFRRARFAGLVCGPVQRSSGQIRPPKENERYFALLRVEAINYQDPNALTQKVFFDDLTPLHPDKRVRTGT